MIEINEEVALSLADAGVGKRFHKMSLTEMGPLGNGAAKWLMQHGAGIKRGTTSAMFYGVGLMDVLTMVVRGLHINGVGSKIVPLVRMSRLRNDIEFKEAVDEIDCLVILNAQDKHRGNPLHDSMAAEVEYLLRKRFDNNQATIMQMAFRPSDAPEERSYWSEDFWDMLTAFETVDEATLLGLNK